MEYKKASIKDLDAVYELVQNTIQTIYPQYYPQEVVNFFCDFHQKENIRQDIEKGKVFILSEDQQLVGTGSYDENHINRVFVSSKIQGNGYGSYILEQLETMLFMQHTFVSVDASLSAAQWYEHHGYKTKTHEKIQVTDKAILAYEVMEKAVCPISYEGKFFTTKHNTANGEVSEQTIFAYHQKDHLVWAEYSGGDIKKGYLLGMVQDHDELDFYYQHVNQKDELKIGKCHSIPKRLKDGKLELSETWEWLNGDQTKGASTLMECDKELYLPILDIVDR